MATLPDVDTDDISLLAYWNAIDQGDADSIDPEDALDDGDIGEYTLYDNGWEGEYTLTTGREATARVKSDGWFVVYIDDTEDYGANEGDASNIRGPWDIANNWTSSSSASSLGDNSFKQAIGSLQGELDNSDDINFDGDDVGIYDYSVGATTLTLLSAHDKADSFDSSIEKDYGFSYTGDTSIYRAVIVAATHSHSYADAEVHDMDDDVVSAADDRVGAVDIIDKIPESETEYTISVDANYSDTAGEYDGDAAHSVIIWWS